MEIRTVKRVEVFGEPWQSKHGPLYNVAVEFEDGSKGIANSKSNVPPYKTGDVVEVTVTGQTQKGHDKIKVSVSKDGVPQSSAGSPSKSSGNGSTNKAIMVQVAFKGAIELASASGVTDQEDIESMTVAFYGIMDRLVNGNEASKPSPKAEVKQEDEDDLPF